MSVVLGQLIVMLGNEVVQTFPVTSPIVSIGRTPDNALMLAHPFVSRQHAELRFEGDSVVLTDLGSSNGTFVSGERILPDQPTRLAPGSAFHIGPFAVIYQLADQPSPVASDGHAAEEPVAESPSTDGHAALADVPLDLSTPAPSLPAIDLSIVRPVAPPRPTWPPPPPHGPHSLYLYDLPVIFHDIDFLGRYLLIEESIWEPLEQRQDHIEMYFDPRTSPRSFLAWLASWLDITFNPHWPESRVRHLLAEAMDLYRWRGTAYGLSRMIEVCTGFVPEITEDPNQPFVFHVRVRVSPEDGIDRDLIEELVQTHKPAHAGYTLETVT